MAALLLALLAVVDSPARAMPQAVADDAATDPVFTSVSGGSRVTVAGAVRSELTAASNLRTTQPGRLAQNDIAAVNVLDRLITAGAVYTRQRTMRLLGGGTKIESLAKIAEVSLLDGAITVDAIETVTSATLTDDGVKRAGGTKFVNIQVQDNELPVVIPKNLTVEIPGLAKVVLNEVKGQVGGDALIKSQATSIHITLLTETHGLDRGAEIEITPTSAKILLPKPLEGDPVFGAGYSTRTRIKLGDTLKLQAGPTSAIIMPAGGTNDMELVNSTAKVNLPGLVRAYALSGSARGTVTDTLSEGIMTGKVADVSLLGGAITVEALTAVARVRKVDDGSPPTVSGGSTLVGLNINGESFPLHVKPNTVVEIPGLVKVIINEQIRQTFPFDGLAVRALHVIALPDAPEEIVGLDLEVGVAAVWVNAE